MKNPFDQNKEAEKYEFFKQMTSAINDWMLKQYPAFDTELVDKIKEIRQIQNDIKIWYEDLNKELKALKERHSNHVIGQVDEFMKKTYPDVSNLMIKNALDLEMTIKTHKNNVEKISKKLDTIIKSDCLYEDVYKLRDEFKDIKKFMEGFQKKIKKAFDV